MSATKRFLITAGLVGVLFAAVSAGLVWFYLADGSVSVNGWLAIGAGAFFTYLLGVGLMALVFFSNASGHDDKLQSLTGARDSSVQENAKRGAQ